MLAQYSLAIFLPVPVIQTLSSNESFNLWFCDYYIEFRSFSTTMSVGFHSSLAARECFQCRKVLDFDFFYNLSRN